MKHALVILGMAALALSCNTEKEDGLTQSALQSIYSSISEGDLATANQKLASVNQLKASPLISNGHTKELYGQVHLLETHTIGGGGELLIYKVETHERNRGIQQRLASEDFQSRRAAGEVKSINEETGIIVFSERKYGFKVSEDGEDRYVIFPDGKAMEAYFPKNGEKVQNLIQQKF